MSNSLQVVSTTGDNRERVSTRLQVSNEYIKWIKSLKPEDKIDAFVKQHWIIAIIIKIEHQPYFTKLLICQYNDLQSSNSHWITISHSSTHINAINSIKSLLISITPSFAIQKLNSHTPIHAFLTDNSHKICSNAGYRKCSICSRKCCTKCFLDRDICNDCMPIHLLSLNSSLRINDKIDVLVVAPSNKCWLIGTILQIKNEDNLTKVLVHYDEWKDRWNEWIMVNHKDIMSSRIRKLHTYTPYHHYLTNPSIKPCKGIKYMYNSRKCNICSRECCLTCYISKLSKGSNSYQCKPCMESTENQQLFGLIHAYSLFYNSYDIEINIIYIITNYAKGIIIACTCFENNEIFYPSQFELEKQAPKKTKKCSICSKNCCMECNMARTSRGSDKYQCKSCLELTEYQQLLEFITSYSLFCNKYDIDIKIILLITSYSQGIISYCPSIVHPCKAEKFYRSKFHFRKRSFYFDTSIITITGRYRTFSCQKKCRRKVTNWDKEIGPNVLRGIHNYGWKNPLPIQKQTILPIMLGHDIIVQSQSWTGKTGAFVISSLHRVNVNNASCQVLILSPTRELAIQTFEVICNLGKNIDGLIRCGLSIEGRVFDSSHIIIGTPQKVNNMVSKGVLNVKSLALIILDEADELLSQTYLFKEEMYKLMQYLPKEVQIALFSATVPDKVLSLAERFMRDPVKILIKNRDIILDDINQWHLEIEAEYLKLATLLHISQSIDFIEHDQVIIFVNTPWKAIWLREKMLQYKFTKVECIHGELTVNDRDSIMREFRSEHIDILIATDILSRGIHVNTILLIINYDLPASKESYIHRIGRSGGCGKTGTVITFVTDDEKEELKSIGEFYETYIQPMPGWFSRVDAYTLENGRGEPRQQYTCGTVYGL